ncbi:HXXEE domain-containing protein [Oceanobacillus iheyensis]|uniref:HXXEE domain-containing protein n=1 Tax=Oceanobacillus iheyensis TaxID=182710 RepID=UPI0000167FB0|nr:HXXEE domain-containing protein [Oceanobacillus iheyensis]
MIFFGVHTLSHIEIILVASFMALLIHQYEEYALPGGAPVIINRALYGETKDYDRFPGNKQSSLVVNMLGWLVYIIPIFFPQFIWLGLGSMFFGFFQFLGHGIQMNLKTKSFYNPGLLAVVLLHVPIGIYYMIYVHSQGLVTGMDYLYGIIAFVISVLVSIGPVKLLQDRKSPYPLTNEEMNRFNIVEKLNKRGVK